MRTLIVNALRALGRPTGPGKHVVFLAQQWSRMELPFDRVVFASPSALHVEGLGTTTEIEFSRFGRRLPKIIWEQVALPIVARNASVLFCPTYTSPLVYPGRVVLANHGIYEAVPDEFSAWARIKGTPINRSSARRADRVIANSMSTKRDLIKFFGLQDSEVDVLYPAAHDMFFESCSGERVAREVTRVLGEAVPYMIFVGKLAKRRNVPNLVRAFARIRQEVGLPHRLLIIGPNTSGVPVDEVAESAGVAGAVTYIPYMEQPPLAKLYAGADLYALPTTYEGISQTMFEAMASGTAVLTVDHPTLEEGGGDAVYSVPTPSVDDLFTGMRKLLTDPGLRKHYEDAGRRRAAKFSWRETAKETMAILDRAARSSDRNTDSVGLRDGTEAGFSGAGRQR